MTGIEAAPATGVNSTISALLADVQNRSAERRPRSGEAFARACEKLPGGNTRSVLYFPPFPIFAEKSSDCRVWDIDGHCYLDFLCEYTAGLAGHDNPEIRAAVEGALRRGWVNGAQLEVEAELATLLCTRFPSLERVRFCNSGTEANLMALSTARVATGRPAIMAFRGGYHGGVLLYKDGPSAQNPPYETVMGEYNDVDRTRDLIGANADRLAAVILEPMLGSGGCIPAERDFLAMLREMCSTHGIVLIFDEVMTSRLAPGGLQGRHGILPDLCTLGKYIGGGFSFGAFGGRAEIMDLYDPRRPDALTHAGTFNNNPFTMNAGVAAMTRVYPADRAEAFNATGDRFRERLQQTADAHAVPVTFSGIGSMIGLHIANGPIRRPGDGRNDATATDAKALIHLEMFERGLYFARRGMIVLSLPMQDDTLDRFVSTLDEVLQLHGPVLRRLA
ncbi:aspartate aminotransferase family protein [Prosthecomicrobium sp. N25]|uniref:aspartate aminotransferase family protein n=1 Tax=Prosthecomicrobium sp. N25 TaxID=3129254 RepID=UPI003077D01A